MQHEDDERLLPKRETTFNVSDQHFIRNGENDRTLHEPTERPPPPAGPGHTGGIGKPVYKTLVDPLDVLALLQCYVCFVLGIQVVRNNVLAWLLRYNGQLTVIGLLLSVMKLCTMRILPTVLFMLEAVYGPSRLQNYDAIMRMSLFASRANTRWRAAITFLLILPPLLSVAFKQFQGGTSSIEVPSGGHYYGMTGPPGLESLGTIGQYLMTNASLPYIVASTPDPITGFEPPLPSFPQAYGFNTLLLSNTSAALLDAPQPVRVAEIQRMLDPRDTWYLHATVNGTVTYNVPSFNRCALNDTESQDPLVPLPDSANFYSLPLYDGAALGVWVNQLGSENESFAYVAMYSAQDFNRGRVDTDTADFANFTLAALQFFTERRQCNGTWRIGFDEIMLQDGVCSDAGIPPQDQAVFANATLALSDWYFPLLAETLNTFVKGPHNSPWPVPTYVVNIASMYWSRVTALVNRSFATANGINDTGLDTQLSYHRPDTIVSTRATMRPSFLVYLIQLVQPLICTVAILYAPFIGTAPISKGFNLTAVLAGLDSGTASKVYGASFSGVLSKPIRMRITYREAGSMELQPSSDPKVVVSKALHVEKKPFWRRLIPESGGGRKNVKRVAGASIVYSLGDQGPNHRLRKNTKYA